MDVPHLFDIHRSKHLREIRKRETSGVYPLSGGLPGEMAVYTVSSGGCLCHHGGEVLLWLFLSVPVFSPLR